MIQIEKGIPIPERSYRNSISNLPFDKMEVGDSFFVPDKTDSTSLATMRVYCSRWAKQLGIKLRVSVQKKASPAGIRVWRVE